MGFNAAGVERVQGDRATRARRQRNRAGGHALHDWNVECERSRDVGSRDFDDEGGDRRARQVSLEEESSVGRMRPRSGRVATQAGPYQQNRDGRRGNLRAPDARHVLSLPLSLLPLKVSR